MCPFCLASLGLVVAKTVSAGGLAAALAVKVSHFASRRSRGKEGLRQTSLGQVSKT